MADGKVVEVVVMANIDPGTGVGRWERAVYKKEAPAVEDGDLMMVRQVISSSTQHSYSFLCFSSILFE